MASIPNLDISQTKVDKLAADLKKLEMSATTKGGDTGGPAVPSFQRQGYLEKLGHTRRKWFKRFFVLRDSFLLSYNLQKSDYTVEPRACVHLGNSKIQLISHGEKEFCFFVTTMEKDQFLFAASSEDERKAWIKDIEIARTITHANMVKLAVENQCLAEQKGVAEVTLDVSVSALSLFSNADYIKNTPLMGGAEGWLRTLGFNPEVGKGGGTFKAKKSSLKKCYFMLRDSHLMMFHGGDILTKPKGVMYLVGTETEITEDEDDGLFRFVCRSRACGDFIELVAGSQKQRNRWVQALKIGARVTYPDFKLLLKEHDLLASVTMTPRAGAPAQPNQPAVALEAPPLPLLAEDVDLQGAQLDPATQQPYDAEGNPLFRNPEGKYVNQEGEGVNAKDARFGAGGEQLDPFNRALPPGAVPMFTEEGLPIGVGPDGKHYLPDGTTIDTSAPHFDANATQLPQETVNAASQIASDVNVAIQVRERLRGEGTTPEAVDALGRTFRGSKDTKSGTITNADGDEVPLKSARRLEGGKLVEYDPTAAPTSNETAKLVIKIDDEGDELVLGDVEITQASTLKDVRGMINSEVSVDYPDFVFLVNQIPMLKYEENERLAWSCLPEIVIRGKELKKVEAKKEMFTKRVETMIVQEENQKKEKAEFDDIMAKVRQGAFLRSAKMAALES